MPAKRDEAELPAARSRRLNQTRLSDPSRPLKQKQRTIACDSLIEAPIDPGESGVSLKKRLPIFARGHLSRSYAAKTPRSTSEITGGLPRREASLGARTWPRTKPR